MATNPNQRKKNESYVEYRRRLQAEQREAKMARFYPRVIWDSARLGTYIREEHGPIGGC